MSEMIVWRRAEGVSLREIGGNLVATIRLFGVCGTKFVVELIERESAGIGQEMGGCEYERQSEH
jgi:hypothetical protein